MRHLFFPFLSLTSASRRRVAAATWGRRPVPSLDAQIAESWRGSARRVAGFPFLLLFAVFFFSAAALWFHSISVVVLSLYAVTISCQGLQLAIIDASSVLPFPIADVCVTSACRGGDVGQAASAVARRADCCVAAGICAPSGGFPFSSLCRVSFFFPLLLCGFSLFSLDSRHEKHSKKLCKKKTNNISKTTPRNKRKTR
jgi:hypothetical protein